MTQEYKTGRNFSGHDRNNPVDYKKVRRDVFNMVEQLVETTHTLSKTLGDQHGLIRASANKTRDMRTKINDLETNLSEAEATEFILRDKIKNMDDLIIELNNDICDCAKEKSKEIN